VNDIEDLRDAMHLTPDFEPKPLDLAHVMDAGGRLRRRRRIVVGAASGLAVLVLLVGGAQLARSNTAASSGQAAAGQQGSIPAVTAEPSASAPAKEPAATGEPVPGDALGAVVDTGMKVEGMDRVLWMQGLDEPSLPNVSIGIVAGRRGPDGDLITDVFNNETEGSDRAPGFHGLEMAMGLGSGKTPAFGYYVGHAAKITVVADGRTVRAHQASWSEDPSVKLFWFDLKKVKPTSKVGKASAYDSNDRKLASGSAGFAVG
jgi:hypothetical protein